MRFNMKQEQAKKDLQKNVEFKYNILHLCSCNLILYDNIDKPSPRQNPIYDISWWILQILSDIIIKLNFSKYGLAISHKL